MYPAGGQPSKELTDKWTWDFFLEAAEKLNKAGHPFGMPMGPTSDAVDWVGAVFAAYGAQFVDEKGNVTVKSDATRQVLEWFKKLVPQLLPTSSPGTTPRTTRPWFPANRRYNEPALGLGRGKARRAAIAQNLGPSVRRKGRRGA